VGGEGGGGMTGDKKRDGRVGCMLINEKWSLSKLRRGTDRRAGASDG